MTCASVGMATAERIAANAMAVSLTDFMGVLRGDEGPVSSAAFVGVSDAALLRSAGRDGFTATCRAATGRNGSQSRPLSPSSLPSALKQSPHGLELRPGQEPSCLTAQAREG